MVEKVYDRRYRASTSLDARARKTDVESAVIVRSAQCCRATTKQQIAQNSGYSAPPKFHIHLPADTRQLAQAATSRNRPAATPASRVQMAKISPIDVTISTTNDA